MKSQYPWFVTSKVKTEEVWRLFFSHSFNSMWPKSSSFFSPFGTRTAAAQPAMTKVLVIVTMTTASSSTERHTFLTSFYKPKGRLFSPLLIFFSFLFLFPTLSAFSTFETSRVFTSYFTNQDISNSGDWHSISQVVIAGDRVWIECSLHHSWYIICCPLRQTLLRRLMKIPSLRGVTPLSVTQVRPNR